MEPQEVQSSQTLGMFNYQVIKAIVRVMLLTKLIGGLLLYKSKSTARLKDKKFENCNDLKITYKRFPPYIRFPISLFIDSHGVGLWDRYSAIR